MKRERHGPLGPRHTNCGEPLRPFWDSAAKLDHHPATRPALARRHREKKKVVKPHDQLVLVSFTHCCASTPSLSTTWSSWGLQEAEASGTHHLEEGFPLRCFQRLSLPNIATRRCHWRDNRNTSGSSNPVLSY